MTRVPSTDVLRLQVADEPVGLVNLVANPNGELGGWGWVTPQANTAINGDSSGLTYASSAVGIQGFQTEDMPITAGRYAAASWRLLGGTPAPNLGLWVNNQFVWLNASGAVISSTTPSPWHQYNDLGVVLYGPNAAPAGAVKFRLRFNLARSNAGDAINNQPCSLRFNQATVATAATPGELGTMIVNLVPDPSLELVPITTNWSASGPNVALARDAGLWANGAASARISSTAVAVRTNWVRNPSFTNDLTDWAALDAHTVMKRALAAAEDGGACLWLNGDDTQSRVTARGTAHNMIPVVTGDLFMGRCRYRFGQAGGNWTNGTQITLLAYFTDAAGALLDPSSSYVIASETRNAADQGLWFDLVSDYWLMTPALVGGKTPAGVRIGIRFSTGRDIAAGMDAFADQFMVEKQIPGGGNIGAYFDGASPDSTEVTYDWVTSSGPNDNARTSTETTKLDTTATPGVRSAEFAVRGGRDYTTSAYALGTGTYSVDVYAQLTWYDIDHHPLNPATTTLNLGRADSVVGGGSFQRLHATATTPPSAAFATVAIYPASLHPASRPFYIDAVQVEPGTLMSAFQIGQVTTGGLPYIPPVSWVDIIGSTHDITVARQSLNVGTMTATILDANLDPATSTLIRPGRACRLMAYPDGGAELSPVFTGAIAQAEVTYDPQTPEPKRARVMLSAVDALARLANIARGEGVGTIHDLPYVLEGCGVPWDVNGSGNQVPSATVVARNDSTSALDQVAITRDSAQGVAWLDRFGTLHAYDTVPSRAVPVVDEDVYSDIDISFNTTAVINEVNLAYQRFNSTTGDTDEIPYGPYVDAESVAEWGAFSADFRVQGIHEDATTLEAWAQTILDANGTPVRRINSVTVPILKPEHITTDRALLDLEALVAVNNLAADLGDDLRVQSIEHRITTTTWVMVLGFGVDGQVASPTFTPAPGNTAGLTLDQILRPLGEVTMFWGLKSAIPAGWLPLDGSTFSLTAYPALAALLGTTTLPDMTDRFPIGSGTKALGTVGGSSTVAAATLAHSHAMPHTHQQADHTHSIPGQAADAAPLSGGTAAGAAPRNTQYGGHNHGGATGAGTNPATGGASAGSTSSGGVASAVDVLNPWRSLWFIIRAV